MYLYIDPDKCTGCGLCELACSFQHEKYFSPSLSRIGVLRNHQKGIFIPLNCTQCEESQCGIVRVRKCYACLVKYDSLVSH